MDCWYLPGAENHSHTRVPNGESAWWMTRDVGTPRRSVLLDLAAGSPFDLTAGSPSGLSFRCCPPYDITYSQSTAAVISIPPPPAPDPGTCLRQRFGSQRPKTPDLLFINATCGVIVNHRGLYCRGFDGAAATHILSTALKWKPKSSSH